MAYILLGGPVSLGENFQGPTQEETSQNPHCALLEPTFEAQAAEVFFTVLFLKEGRSPRVKAELILLLAKLD